MACSRAAAGDSGSSVRRNDYGMPMRAAFLTLAIALSVLLLAACGVAAPDSRADCMRHVLAAQSGLRNGVAAFTDTDGQPAIVAADLTGRVRLLLGRRYAAASLTKPRVGHVVRNMVGDGALDLDTPIDALLPADTFSTAADGVTVRHLLQHTAGFSPPANLDPLWWRDSGIPASPDCAAAARYILTLPPGHTAGAQTAYSNAGYCLLGEIILQYGGAEHGLTPEFKAVLQSDLGAAGGWTAPLPELHTRLLATLPLEVLPAPVAALGDGSWYSHGWRWRPDDMAGAPWTHTGRLPGMLAVALTDGEAAMVVAHFDGDPADYLQAADQFGRQAWQCMAHPR